MNRALRPMRRLMLALEPVWLRVHRLLRLQRDLRRRSVHMRNLPAGITHLLIPGAGVGSDGSISAVLQERLERALELLRDRPDLYVVVSGDGRASSGCEDRSMAAFLTKRGVPAARLFRDGHGFSTRETVMRFRRQFGARSLVLVTNDFHAARAVNVAVLAGLDCYIVDDYRSRSYTDAERPLRWDERRELIAHIKDRTLAALGW